ncbi:putative ribonuclease H-like domain-containing protein, partial [Tanacetum coccineum]
TEQITRIIRTACLHVFSLKKNPRLYYKPYKMKAGLKQCKRNCFSSNYRRFRNKRDERSIVVKNKARLVAQGFRQEEGIDYDEVFAPIARIEAIRLFLAFASYMGFTVYQMDVKSAFLYDTIEDEVYVHQPPGFVDPAHPNKVYKMIKALYGLHQAPRAWYETLSSFLMENGFRRDLAFDDLDDIVDDAMDYMESEDAQDEGRTSSVVLEEKENADKEVTIEAPVSTDKQDEGTDKKNEGTDKQDGGTDSTEVSTDRQGEGTVDQNEGKNATQTAPTPTSTPTLTIFGDDETIAQVLIIMSQNKQKEKEKGVEIRNVEDTERPRSTLTRSILTLRPLPKIDPKDKGKKRIEEEDESDTESEGITEAEKKFKQLANDEEVARKVQEEWEAEEEKKRLAEEEATKAALSNEYDFIQARLNADKILAKKLQEEEREREMYTIEQRTKFLHDTIAAQRRFFAQQRSEAIRNKPPSRNQLRNQMMTYLKHVGGKKHSDLKTKSFDEIQVLYEKIKRSDDSFIAIGSAEDEKMIKEMNEQAADASKKRVKKDDSVKGEIKEEEGTRKRKLGKRKKMKSKKRKFTSKDDEELRLCLTIAPDEDKEVDYEILDKKYPIIEWRSEYLTTKPQYDETKEVEYVYLNVVIRSNRQRRYFSTLMAVIFILDRDDICAIYQLVMNKYQDETPEGFDKILWGDLIIVFNQKLKLETEEKNTMALELVRFLKKQIAELEPNDSDGDEEDP